ncbi:hypothetical protein GN316_17375 [Xylophilus sp. Kf1]|nr:hypothetical protein [Xylophilus sp. Kf1]
MKKPRPVVAHPASAIPAFPMLTAANIEHTRALLREVGALAALALDTARKPLPADQEAEDLQCRVSVLQRLLDRIGWVADVGLRELGDSGSFARAEDWLLADVMPVSVPANAPSAAMATA